MRFSTRPQRDPVGPGQESCWDYPRPPRLEPVTARLRVVLGGVTVADTTHGHRVLETSHPPNYYFPLDDVSPGALVPVGGSSYCEWKGRARYYDLVTDTKVAPKAAWTYLSPTRGFEPITGAIAVMAGQVDRCSVNGETVVPQPGGFYGGWVTSWVVGPFKGIPGSMGW